MRLKNILTVITLFITLASVGQYTKDGTVIAIVPVGGNQSYCVIQEDNVENYYKTGLYTTGDLTQSQPVQLRFETNGTIQVLAQSLQTTLYCNLIQQGTINDDWLQFLSGMPTVVDGILFFDDTTQLRVFYESVDEAISESGQDIDEMLDILDAQFPLFTSYRRWFNNEHNWLNGAFTSAQIEQISQLDFINDEIQKTLLNEERMIGISDSIYYLHASNVMMAFDADYARGKTMLAGLPDDYDAFGFGSIVLEDTAVKIISDLYNPGSGPKGVAVVTDSLYYESDPLALNIPCEVFKKKLYVHITEFLTTPSGLSVSPHTGGTLTIDWGDGYPAQTITNYESGWVEHIYPNTGTFYPNTTYTFDDMYGGTVTLVDGNGTGGENIEIIVDQSCTQAELSVYSAEALGDYLMGTKLWVEHNYLFKRIGSYTHAWKKNGSGIWERHKADIYTSVYGIFRDENCTIQKIEDGYDYQHSQKKVQKTKIKMFKYYSIENGDVNSSHYMVKGATFLQLNQTINPC